MSEAEKESENVLASKSWCVLLDTNVKNFPYMCDIGLKYDLIFEEDFLLNPDQYRHRIVALIGGFQQCSKDERFFSRMPNVRVLLVDGAGTDHLDLPMLWRRGIRVANTGQTNGSAAAELGFALMLASARNLKRGLDLDNPDKMDVALIRAKNCGTRLLGATLGIVGMGSIGYMVAERAAAFKMRVLYHNRKPRSEEDEKRVRATYCDSLEKLLVQSDFVMVCVPLTNATKGMIRAKELKLLKPTSVLINIARGDVVDQDALTTALQTNAIGGAALDVTTPEPLPKDHPLLHMSNVIVTPHFGGATKESRKEMGRILIENLFAGLEGKPMSHELKS